MNSSVSGITIHTWPARTLYWAIVSLGGFEEPDQKLEADGQDGPARANGQEFGLRIVDRGGPEVGGRHHDNRDRQYRGREGVASVPADAVDQERLAEHVVGDGDRCHHDPRGDE